ncbi:GNAT family N-acetyltransferase [Streptomyces sp. NPDC054956]
MIRLLRSRRGAADTCRDGHHVLRTPRLLLRTPRSQFDFWIGTAAASDPEAQHWFGWPAEDIQNAETSAFLLALNDANRAVALKALPRTLRKAMAQSVELPDSGQEHRLLAVDAADGSCVGMGSVTRHDASVGIWLAPAYRGRGYGTELVGAITEFGHRHLGLETLTAGTETTNAPCRRTLLAGGFTETEGARTHTLPDGRVIDPVWFRRQDAAAARCTAP